MNKANSISKLDSATVEQVAAKMHSVEAALGEVILGKPGLIRDFITGLLSRGHILLEGLPGLGKTQMVAAFASLSDLESRRVQFTPDLMPLDITGSNILHDVDGKRGFEFHEGPIFANLVLADEINRASPKTQSALLEAMQERRVTVLGTTHDLPRPFLVMATQNPIELEGTYPLPEAQLDRFLFKLTVKDVSAKVLEQIITKRGRGDLPQLSPILNRDDLMTAMEAVDLVELSGPVASYIARLVNATHPDASGKIAGKIRYGASPRAALALSVSSRARALLNKRVTVGFEDIKAVALPVLRHRIILDYTARLEGITTDDIITELLINVKELERQAPPNIVEKLTS